jgi:hypothetical protein
MPGREPEEYRDLHEYVDDLCRVLDREQRRAAADEAQEARRRWEAADRVYTDKLASYETWRRTRPQGDDFYVPARPDPPPLSWARIKLKLGIDDVAPDDAPPEEQEAPATSDKPARRGRHGQGYPVKTVAEVIYRGIDARRTQAFSDSVDKELRSEGSTTHLARETLMKLMGKMPLDAAARRKWRNIADELSAEHGSITLDELRQRAS